MIYTSPAYIAVAKTNCFAAEEFFHQVQILEEAVLRLPHFDYCLPHCAKYSYGEDVHDTLMRTSPLLSIIRKYMQF